MYSFSFITGNFFDDNEDLKDRWRISFKLFIDLNKRIEIFNVYQLFFTKLRFFLKFIITVLTELIYKNNIYEFKFC